MPFDVIGRTGPGMRHVVGFVDRFTGRSTFRGEFGGRQCDEWGLAFAATRPSSQITLGSLVLVVLDVVAAAAAVPPHRRCYTELSVRLN